MKVAITILFVLLCTGCQSTATSIQNDSAKEQNKSNVSKDFAAKLRTDGAKILCDQEAYTSCYKISRAQCLTELEVINSDCLDKMDQLHGNLSLRNNFASYARGYSACLIYGHIIQDEERYSEISSCIKQAEMDKSAIVKLLLE